MLDASQNLAKVCQTAMRFAVSVIASAEEGKEVPQSSSEW